jgi:hypothetical protein
MAALKRAANFLPEPPPAKAAPMVQDLPEQLLGQGRGPLLVGVREVIARRRRGAANGQELPPQKPQAIADIVETDGVRELREEQRNHMAPGTERARLVGGTGVASQLGNQVSRYEIAELTQNGEFRTGWRLGSFIFHLCRVAEPKPVASLFSHQPVGWL